MWMGDFCVCFFKMSPPGYYLGLFYQIGQEYRLQIQPFEGETKRLFVFLVGFRTQAHQSPQRGDHAPAFGIDGFLRGLAPSDSSGKRTSHLAEHNFMSTSCGQWTAQGAQSKKRTLTLQGLDFSLGNEA